MVAQSVSDQDRRHHIDQRYRPGVSSVTVHGGRFQEPDIKGCAHHRVLPVTPLMNISRFKTAFLSVVLQTSSAHAVLPARRTDKVGRFDDAP